jgi:PPOX class probable F420-dependent enzyme
VSTQTKVIPEHLTYLLEGKTFPVVATVGPHGEPQANPVWFGWDGELIRFSQSPTTQKVRNLKRDNRIALAFLDVENPYIYLEVRGTVVDIEEDPDLTFLNSMAKKYLDQDKYPWHQEGDQHVVVIVKPEHTTSMG